MNSGQTMTTEYVFARKRAHRANIERYRKILQTQLTDLERDYVTRRLAEERRALRDLDEQTQECSSPEISYMFGGVIPYAA
jgi:hypothetical protein